MKEDPDHLPQRFWTAETLEVMILNMTCDPVVTPFGCV